MNESDARSAFLVRAFETAPPDPADRRWAEDDRAWATQAALHAEGATANIETLIARRAHLAAERLGSRDPGARRVVRMLTWHPWVGWLFAGLAFVAGLASDALGPTQRINLLAAPLLALLAWNLAVYAVIAGGTIKRIAGAGARPMGPLARQFARLARALAGDRGIGRLAPPLAGFARDWAVTCASLTASRVALCFHLAAATFALGVLSGMYVRGLGLEYRAGWDSTFLTASSVHAILAMVLGPATRISGIAMPDEAALAAIRLSLSPGENAARWIHLYATTVALFVLVPRGLLAAGHFVRERRLAGRFPLPLDDAYFGSLARALRGEAARIHVVPYSFELPPSRSAGLNALMARAFGAATEVKVAATVRFGDEDAADPGWLPDAPVTLVAALFSLAATPERESHGRFIETLAARLPASTRLVMLVDESGFLQRFGRPDGATRRSQRRAAWQSMLAETGREAIFVDLEDRHPLEVEAALRQAMDQAATCATRA